MIDVDGAVDLIEENYAKLFPDDSDSDNDKEAVDKKEEIIQASKDQIESMTQEELIDLESFLV